MPLPVDALIPTRIIAPPGRIVNYAGIRPNTNLPGISDSYPEVSNNGEYLTWLAPGSLQAMRTFFRRTSFTNFKSLPGNKDLGNLPRFPRSGKSSLWRLAWSLVQECCGGRKILIGLYLKYAGDSLMEAGRPASPRGVRIGVFSQLDF